MVATHLIIKLILRPIHFYILIEDKIRFGVSLSTRNKTLRGS